MAAIATASIVHASETIPCTHASRTIEEGSTSSGEEPGQEISFSSCGPITKADHNKNKFFQLMYSGPVPGRSPLFKIFKLLFPAVCGLFARAFPPGIRLWKLP